MRDKLIRKVEIRDRCTKSLRSTICVHTSTDYYGPLNTNEGMKKYYKVSLFSGDSTLLTMDKFSASEMLHGSMAWEVLYWALIGEAIANDGDIIKIKEV